MRKSMLLLALTLMALIAFSVMTCAETVLLTEGFEGTTGSDISTLGWAQTETGPAITISGTLIDSGKSGVVAASDGVGNASVYRKTVAATIGATEEVVLTATVRVYAQSFISDEAGVYVSTSSGYYYMAAFKSNEDGVPPLRQWKIKTPTQLYPTIITRDLPTSSGAEVKDYDIKIVVSNTRTWFYGRVHGAADWTFLYDTSGASSVTDVTIWMQNLNYDDPPGDSPYVDSVRLVKNAQISDSYPQYSAWESFTGTAGASVSTLGWTSLEAGPVSITDGQGIDAETGQSAISYWNGGASTSVHKLLDTPITLGDGDVLVMTSSTYAWSNFYCDNIAEMGVETNAGTFRLGMHSPPRTEVLPSTDPKTWNPAFAIWCGAEPDSALSGEFVGATEKMDVKMVVSRNTVRYYVRPHGTTDWTLVYTKQNANVSVVSSLVMRFYESNWSWPSWWVSPRVDEIVLKRYVGITDPTSVVLHDGFDTYPANQDLRNFGWQPVIHVDGFDPSIISVAEGGRGDGMRLDSGPMARSQSLTNWPGADYKRTLAAPVQIAAGQSVSTMAVFYANAGPDCWNDTGVYVLNPAGARWALTLSSAYPQSATASTQWMFSSPTGNWTSPVAKGGVYDGKIVVTPTGCQFYGREYATGDWNLLGGDSTGSSSIAGLGMTLYTNDWSPNWFEWTYLDTLNMFGGNGAAGQAVTIANAKKLNDNTIVSCSGTVTAVFGDSFYVEANDRASGIRVTKSGHGVSTGQGVVVVGKMATLPSTERYIAADTIGSANSATILPLGMNNKAVGGAVVSGATGLENIGLLVKTTGIASSSDQANSFNLDDGSGVPLRAFLPLGGTLPTSSKYVAVTGISSCDKIGSNVQRMLQVVSCQTLN